MNIDLKNPRFYLISSMIAAIPAIPLQTIAYLTSYGDSGLNYFQAGTWLPLVAGIFSALSCLLAIVAIFFWKEDPIFIGRPNGSLASFPAALGFLIGGVLMLLTQTDKLTYVLPIFCLLAAIYHIAAIFSSKQGHTSVALIGFSSVIACILFNGYFYFDGTLEMNAPLKVTIQMAFLAAMLYFISELRVLLGIALPRIYLLVCALTIGIGALSAIPVPLAYLLGVFKPQSTVFDASLTEQLFDHPEYLAGSVVLLGICITAICRLCQAMNDDNEEDA